MVQEGGVQTEPGGNQPGEEATRTIESNQGPKATASRVHPHGIGLFQFGRNGRKGHASQRGPDFRQ
jgi:hypothetical protein